VISERHRGQRALGPPRDGSLPHRPSRLHSIRALTEADGAAAALEAQDQPAADPQPS
jgi:hypothetical protein